MNIVELEKHPIYLGCIEEEGIFKKIILCTKISKEQCLNLENGSLYPKIDYKVERGIIQCPKMNIIKMVDLSYLLQLLKYPTINELAEQLTTTMLRRLMEEDANTFDLHQLNYLKKIYSLLQMNELEEKQFKVSRAVKTYLYK